MIVIVFLVIQNIFLVAGFKSKGVSEFQFSIWIATSATFGAILGPNNAVDIIFNKYWLSL